MREDRAELRLLFDENLPWRVAASLKVLGFSVSHVGDDTASPKSPPRGSPDDAVLRHAAGVNQVIVTSNLDMVLLCTGHPLCVIWIDPYGRQFQRTDLAVLALKGINDWSDRLNTAVNPVCVRALRTKTETLQLDEAVRRVRERMSRISRKQTLKKKPRPSREIFPTA